MRLALAAALIGATACATIEPVEPPEPPKLEGNVPAIGRQLDLEVEGRGTPVRLQGVTGRVTAVCVLGAGKGATQEAAPAPPAQAEPQPTADAATADAAKAGATTDDAAKSDTTTNDAAKADAITADAAPAGAAEDAGTADENRVDAPEEAPAAEAAPGTRLPPLPASARTVLEACTSALAELRDQIAVVGLTTDPVLDLDQMPLRTYRDPEGKALEEKLELKPVSQVIVVDVQGRVAEILAPADAGRLRTAAARLAR